MFELAMTSLLFDDKPSVTKQNSNYLSNLHSAARITLEFTLSRGADRFSGTSFNILKNTLPNPLASAL
jgi:hypothetical protein